jgi:hypothetical protein
LGNFYRIRDIPIRPGHRTLAESKGAGVMGGSFWMFGLILACMTGLAVIAMK